MVKKFRYGNWILFGTISKLSNSVQSSEQSFIKMPISDHIQQAKSILFDM